jgi:ubiquinone/menaquinone biosynthesis C-methylase UbiE
VIGPETIAWKTLQTLADRLRSAQTMPGWPPLPTGETVAYTLSAEEPELQRLITQATVWEPMARWLFDQFPVPEGGRVADVACGPLGVLHVLRDLVGDDGEVVGIDREPRMLALAREVTDERGLDVELIEADAADSGLPDGSFDVVHCRTLLVNVTNPADIVREMLRITRPGGTTAIQEPDGNYWICDPPHPAWDRVHEAVAFAFQFQGRTFDIGTRLGRMLDEAGAHDVQTHAHVFQTRHGDAYQTLLLRICDAVRPLLYDSGRYDATAVDSIIAAAAAHLDDPRTTTAFAMWQAWGTKPH